MSALLPCPFCGGKAALFRGDRGTHTYAGCTHLDCHVEGSEWPTSAEAAAAWNTRTAATPSAPPLGGRTVTMEVTRTVRPPITLEDDEPAPPLGGEPPRECTPGLDGTCLGCGRPHFSAVPVEFARRVAEIHAAAAAPPRPVQRVIDREGDICGNCGWSRADHPGGKVCPGGGYEFELATPFNKALREAVARPALCGAKNRAGKYCDEPAGHTHIHAYRLTSDPNPASATPEPPVGGGREP
jgi:hypothetical protein